MKKFLLFLSLAFILRCNALFSQTPEVKLPLTISDGVNSQLLYFGLDPSATDGLDLSLGEQELPPLPPTGIFDARFLLPPNQQIGSLSDYRTGTTAYDGEKTYNIQYQIGDGSSITLRWNLPIGVTGVLKDLLGGLVVNVDISDTGNYTVPNNSITQLQMVLTYKLGGVSPPLTPILLKPDSGATGVSMTPELTWHASTGVSTYHLQASTEFTFTTGIIFNDSTLTDTTKQLNGLSGDTQYFWRVNAKNSGGTSDYSTVFNFTTLPVQNDQVKIPITITDGVTSQVLNFGLDPSATDGLDNSLGEQELPPLPPGGVFDARFLLPPNQQIGSLLDLRNGNKSTKGDFIYNIQYQIGSGSAITLKWGLPSGVTGELKDLLGGLVVNVKMSDSGSYTVPNNSITQLQMIIMYNPALPSPPVLLKPDSGSTGVSLTPELIWHNSEGVETYHLQAGTDPSFATGIIFDNSTLTDTTKLLTGLIYDTKYFWRVKAKNIAGISEWSTTFNFTTIIEVVSAPTNLASDANQINKVILTWTDNSNNESGFKLERTDADGNTFNLLTTIHSDSTFFIDSTVQEGKTYKYRIKAYKQSIESQYSNESIILTPISSINPPSNVTVTPDTAGHFQITWQDNSTNEKGFIINRGIVDSATSPGVAYGIFSIDKTTDIILEYSPIDTLPANSTEYIDVNSKEGIYYKYKVEAYNSDGVSLGKTDTTKTTVTTLIAPSNLNVNTEGSTKVNIKLIWKNNSLKALGIIIERADNNPSNFVILDSVNSNVSGFIDTLTEKTHIYYYRLKAYDGSITSAYSSVASVQIITEIISSINIPVKYNIFQNYPNPFNPSTIIKYDIPKESFVTIKIYDILGREVKTLVNEDKPAGRYKVQFDASDIASGVYIYQIRAGSFIANKKLVLMK